MTRSQRTITSWICDACLFSSRTFITRSKVRGFATSGRRASATRKPRLPDSPARTRFAPSPTGSLHLGSIRTALFNYLLAKRTNGQFLLRIEDTDQKRTVPGAEEQLYRDLRWAGLEWDEGPEVGGPYGPYRQSERLFLYNTHIQTLLKNGSAYRCFCSVERLDGLSRSRHDRGLPAGYDRNCTHIPAGEAESRAKGESHIIRFKIPKEYPKYNDLVYGKSGHGDGKTKQSLIEEPVYDDPVLIKSDGFPTYHFANVVDDYLMQITHVIRGSEWMSSTPLHIALYNALDWHPPQYGHVPLLVDEKRQKLSKRNFDSDISSFRDKVKIFPETLTNFAALLGWSHQQKSDVMDLEELKKAFDLKITKGNTIVAFEKLNFLQEKHARRRIDNNGEQLDQIIEDVSAILRKTYDVEDIKTLTGSRDLNEVITSMLKIESLPYRNPTQFVESIAVFFAKDSLRTRKPLDEVIPQFSVYKDLTTAASTLFMIPDSEWSRATLKIHLSQLDLTSSDPVNPETPAIPATKYMYQFLRWALLGGHQGPDVAATLEVLGKDIAHKRIKEAILVSREVLNEKSPAMVTARRVQKGLGNSALKGKGEWQAHRLPAATTAL